MTRPGLRWPDASGARLAADVCLRQNQMFDCDLTFMSVRGEEHVTWQPEPASARQIRFNHQTICTLGVRESPTRSCDGADIARRHLAMQNTSLLFY